MFFIYVSSLAAESKGFTMKMFVRSGTYIRAREIFINANKYIIRARSGGGRRLMEFLSTSSTAAKFFFPPRLYVANARAVIAKSWAAAGLMEKSENRASAVYI